MPEVLELTHLAHQHGVAEVEVGAGGIEARLHAQWTALGETRGQLRAHVQIDDAAGQLGEGR